MKERMKSQSTIRKAKRALRRVVDHSPDPCEQRIAYAMETAITWAREHTVGWPAMDVEARTLAQLLRNELGR